MAYNTSMLRTCGEDVLIADLVEIRYPELVSIGSHVAIDPFFHLSTQLVLGSYIHLGPHVSIIGGRGAKLVIEDFSGLSAGCRMICGTDDPLGSGMGGAMIPERYRGEVTISTIVLEKHSALGTNCVVFPGVTIGEGAFAAACSVVKKDMKPWTIYAGNPARVICPRPRDKILALEAQMRRDLGIT